jgi:signal transduction histidine kinase
VNSTYSTTDLTLGTKHIVDSYRPTLLLVAVLVALCAGSILMADRLTGDDSSLSAAPAGEYVASKISEIGSQVKQGGQAATADSDRDSMRVLIFALIAAALTSAGVVFYLNRALVRARRQIHDQKFDLRVTKQLEQRFLASATHELNTPLTVTSALTDVLAKNKEGNLTERQLKQITAVQRNNRRLSEMVDVMIQSSVAGIDDGLRIEQIQYSEFIESAIKSIQADLALQGVQLEWSVMPSPDVVSIDSERISKVVSNLLINAGQNTPEGAIVFLSTERIGTEVRTCVRDFGPGISIDDRPHVFSPFYRGDSEVSRRNRGVGLGLTVAKQIIEGHGGEIGFESNATRSGVTFCFTLPIAS